MRVAIASQFRPRHPASRLMLPGACLMILTLGACSHEAMYQSIQQDGLRGCEQIPVAQQASCKAQYQKDYATYKRERDSLGTR